MDDQELTPTSTPDALESTTDTVAERLEALTLSVSQLAQQTEAMTARLEQLTAANASAAAQEAAEAVEEQREELQELATPAAMPVVTVGAATSAIDPETLAPTQVPPMGSTPPPATSSRKRRGLFRSRVAIG